MPWPSNLLDPYPLFFSFFISILSFFTQLPSPCIDVVIFINFLKFMGRTCSQYVALFPVSNPGAQPNPSSAICAGLAREKRFSIFFASKLCPVMYKGGELSANPLQLSSKSSFEHKMKAVECMHDA